MSKSLQQMTQTFAALSNDLLYLVRGNNDYKIRVDDILPNIGVGGYESLTYAQLAAKVNNSELVTGRTYFINDKDIFVKAITKSRLDAWAIWLQRLPDYNNLTGNFIGIWEDTLTPQVGDLVAWNGIMYENTTGVNNVNPPNLDAINWLQLPYTDTRYNIEFAALLYDFENDIKIKVLDKRGNDICQTAIEEFKFGDDNVKYNKVENGGIFKSLNCFSALNNNDISAAKVDVNLNKGIFEKNRIFGGFNTLNYFNTLTYTGLSYDEFRGNKIYLKESYTITGSHVNEVLDKDFSTFKSYIDITGNNHIDLINVRWAGVIILESSNPTEYITSILYMSSHKVRFETKAGLEVIFVHGNFGNANVVVNNTMIGMSTYRRVNTATDGSFIEYRLSGVNPIEVGYGKYN